MTERNTGPVTSIDLIEEKLPPPGETYSDLLGELSRLLHQFGKSENNRERAMNLEAEVAFQRLGEICKCVEKFFTAANEIFRGAIQQAQGYLQSGDFKGFPVDRYGVNGDDRIFQNFHIDTGFYQNPTIRDLERFNLQPGAVCRVLLMERALALQQQKFGLNLILLAQDRDTRSLGDISIPFGYIPPLFVASRNASLSQNESPYFGRDLSFENLLKNPPYGPPLSVDYRSKLRSALNTARSRAEDGSILVEVTGLRGSNNTRVDFKHRIGCGELADRMHTGEFVPSDFLAKLILILLKLHTDSTPNEVGLAIQRVAKIN